MTTWSRPLVHFEIQGRDPKRLQDFYKSMFEWKINGDMIAAVEPGIGGPEMGVGGHILPGDAARTILYIQVADLPASLRQAEELGGTVVAQPIDVPGGPTIAKIADPEGNQIGLVQQ